MLALFGMLITSVVRVAELADGERVEPGLAILAAANLIGAVRAALLVAVGIVAFVRGPLAAPAWRWRSAVVVAARVSVAAAMFALRWNGLRLPDAVLAGLPLALGASALVPVVYPAAWRARVTQRAEA